MADDKIEIPISINASGVSAEVQRASNQVGKAAVGMARGISAAVGQSLGPLGEAIEKLDTMKAALGSLTAGSKLWAAGITAAAVAAVYGVKEAVEAFKEMRDAQNGADESAKRLAASQKQLAGSIEGGITASQRKAAIDKANARIAELEAENLKQVSSIDEMGGMTTESALNPAQIAANKAEIERLKNAIKPENLDAAVAKGEARMGAAMLDPRAAKTGRAALLEQNARADFGTFGTGQSVLSGMRQTREEAMARLANLQSQPLTTQTAPQRNAAQALLDRMDELIPIYERIADEFAKARQAEESPRKTGPTAGITTDGTLSTLAGVPTGYGVSGYTSIGGGGAISGITPGQDPIVVKVANNVERIANAIENSGPLLMKP